MQDLPPYAHAGARALVALHERHLRAWVATWQRARAVRVALPATADPDYASLEHLGVHVLGCARHYLTWSCDVLGLPDPGIQPTPQPELVAEETDVYLDHLLILWRAPLADVAPDRFEAEDHASRWGNLYSVDAMLEHAVMHPMRHAYQLEALLE